MQQDEKNLHQDKMLYEEFLKGDILSFEQLVLNYKDSLIYFLQRYVKDIYVCEDIAQDVFAFIYVYKDKYDVNLSFKTYLFTIARNKAIDYIRKNNKLVPFEQLNEQQTDKEELLEKVIKDETVKLLHKALDSMKPDYQKAIHLIDFEEMTYNDAASVMGKTITQFKVLLFRARKVLKKTLEKEGYTYEN